MPNTIDVINRRFGIKTTSRLSPEDFQLGVDKIRILPINPRRLAFLYVNLGNANNFIAPFSGVSSTRGILLSPNGGSYAAIYSEDFELVCREWWGVSDGAAQSGFYIEVLCQG